MQVSVDIQWARPDKALRDDPNETFAVFYYSLLIEYRWRQAVCPTDRSPNQLLPESNNDLFLLCGEDFRSRAGQRNKIMFHWCSFLNMNRCKYGTQNECLHILFFYNPNRFFCNSWDLFNCKCNSFKVKLNYKHREIDFVVTLGPGGRTNDKLCCKLVF